jgi:hypothetical protein
MPYFTDVQVTPDTMYLGIGASYELTVQNPGPKTSGIFFYTDVEAPGRIRHRSIISWRGVRTQMGSSVVAPAP